MLQGLASTEAKLDKKKNPRKLRGFFIFSNEHFQYQGLLGLLIQAALEFISLLGSIFLLPHGMNAAVFITALISKARAYKLYSLEQPRLR